MNNYYEVLGISPDASSEEIRRKYLFLVKAWHPDKFQDPTQKARADERMKRINEAYTVLGSPDRRAKYDRERKAYASPPPTSSGQRQANAQSYQSPPASGDHRQPNAQSYRPAPAGNATGRKTVNNIGRFRLLVFIFCLLLVLWTAFTTYQKASTPIPFSTRAEMERQLLGIEQTVVAARETKWAPTAIVVALSTELESRITKLHATETAKLEAPGILASVQPVAATSTELRPTDTPEPVPSRPTITVQLAAATIAPGEDTAMVSIPAGSFWMGAAPGDADANNTEKPAHAVELSAYWIDKTEVTNAMFARFVEETGYRTDAEKLGSGWVLDLSKNNWEETQGADWRHPHGPGSSLDGLEQHPVVQVSWNDAAAYCGWRGARLPTEAEWEKAARGTDGRIYPWGDRPPDGVLANFADLGLGASWSDQTIEDGHQYTAPVGSYRLGASPYGLLDMAGNVWEWVQDWYADDTYQVSLDVNPTGPDSGTAKSLRGGCWGDPARNLRASVRYRFEPDYRIDDFGFRCAR
jgi:formylglycine-generating enzyme